MNQEEREKKRLKQIRSLKAIIKKQEIEHDVLIQKIHYYGGVFTDYQEKVNQLESKVKVLMKDAIDSESLT